MIRMHRAAGCRRKNGYSLVEVIISMALVVLLSVTGYAACYVSLRVQERSRDDIYIWDAADSFRTNFAYALDLCAAADDPAEQVQNFLSEYSALMAFALDCWQPNVENFRGEYALDSQPWTAATVTSYDEVVTPVVGEDGSPVLDEHGQPLLQTKRVPVSGFELAYKGANAENAPSMQFSYYYYTSFVEIRAELDLSQHVWALSVAGARAGADEPTYSFSEEFEP